MTFDQLSHQSGYNRRDYLEELQNVGKYLTDKSYSKKDLKVLHGLIDEEHHKGAHWTRIFPPENMEKMSEYMPFFEG